MKPATKPLTKAELRRLLETKLRDLAVGGDVQALKAALERLDGDAGSLAAQVNRLPAAALEALASRLDHTTRGGLLEAMGAVMPEDIRGMGAVEREQRLLAVKLELERLRQQWPSGPPQPSSGEPIIKASVAPGSQTIAALEEAAAEASQVPIEEMSDEAIEAELHKLRTMGARRERR